MRPALVALLAALALVGAAAPSAAGGEATSAGGHLCPREVATEQFDARKLVGMRVGDARRKAERHNCLLRVVRRDGEWLVVTQDFLANRINVAVRDRRVRRIVGIY
jgi:hypothetical protein